MTINVLRKVLALDAASCLGFFAACVPFTAVVSALVGLPGEVIAAGGWICLAAGLLFAALALSRAPSPLLVAFGALGNALWVSASLGVVAVFGRQMNGAGIAVVLGQAGAVGVLAWLEVAGARSMGRMAEAAKSSPKLAR